MKDIDDIPMYEFHTLYYLYWREQEAIKKMTDEQKSAMALGEAMSG